MQNSEWEHRRYWRTKIVTLTHRWMVHNLCGKPLLLREIARQTQPFSLTFSGAPRVELKAGEAPLSAAIANQPLPPPPPASWPRGGGFGSQRTEDGVEDLQRTYAEGVERQGKRFVRLHVLPCFV